MFMGRSMNVGRACRHPRQFGRHRVHAPPRRRAARRRRRSRCAPASSCCSAAIFLWSGMHGITSLLISFASFPWPEREQLLRDMCELQLRALDGGGTVNNPTVRTPTCSGNFAPVADERDDADLDVTGAIPPALDGLLLRNGPNPIAPDPGGLPLVHRRRDAARHRAARRSRALPQSLGPYRRRVRRARRGATGRPAGRRVRRRFERREHPRRRARRPDLRPRRGEPADRGPPRPLDGRAASTSAVRCGRR